MPPLGSDKPEKGVNASEICIKSFHLIAAQPEQYPYWVINTFY
jgi:hypothetical protein